MSNFDATGIESIKIVREDNEDRTLALKIECEDGTSIDIYVGRYHEDGETIRDLLRDAATAFTKAELDDWQDVPDFDDDGFICDADREPGYYVSLSGHYWTDGVLLPHSRTAVNHEARPFPTRDIAAYELACAMSAEGYFPNAWYQNDRGYTDDIGEEVRKWHDEGGDKPITLEGATFEAGTDVVIGEANATIVKDYGAKLGVVFRYDYDTTDSHTTDRATILPYVLCKHCEEPIKEDDNGAGGKVWCHLHGSTVCYDVPAGSHENDDSTTTAEPLAEGDN